MASPPEPRSARLFHLRAPPESGRARLCEEDEHHALRVLRIGPGDHLLVGDGQGSAWPLRVLMASRSGLELEVTGQPIEEARAGSPVSRVPWVEVAVALPRGGRADEMVGRLTQLGAGAVTPLVCDRVQGPLRELGPARAEHLRRAMREACKQCRRLWLPELRAPLEPASLRAAHPEAELLLLDPDADQGLLDWARAQAPDAGSVARPVLVVVGPEGGLTAAERSSLGTAGAHEVRVGPYLLRVETAAEAAVAMLVLSLQSS